MKPMTPMDARRSLAYAEKYDTHLAIGHRRALETIAGMHEEWGVRWDDDPSYGPHDWGFPTRAAAEQWAKKNRHNGPDRGRIVRRYTTEPEGDQ